MVAQDGITYEKDNIEKWFQTTGTNNSPMTGLPIGTSLVHNRALYAQVTEWRKGVDLIKAEISHDKHTSSFPKRRGRGSRALNSISWRSGTELLTISMIMDTRKWEFSVPRKIRYETLRALAFRCLNGETTTFTLLYNGNHLPLDLNPETWSEPLVSVHPGMTIAIHKDTMLRGLDTASSNSTIKPPTPPERILVKLYRPGQLTPPIFTFWILNSIQANVGWVLWDYWRHTKGSLLTTPNQYTIWGAVKYKGDQYIGGCSFNPWEPLSQIITRCVIEGTTENQDPLYDRVVKDEEGDSDTGISSRIPPEKRAKVLKLLLFDNTKAKSKGRRRAKMGKALTRVSLLISCGIT